MAGSKSSFLVPFAKKINLWHIGGQSVGEMTQVETWDPTVELNSSDSTGSLIKLLT